MPHPPLKVPGATPSSCGRARSAAGTEVIATALILALLALFTLPTQAQTETRLQVPEPPLTLKAGTPLTIASRSEFIPKKAQIGDSIDFSTVFPVRSGKVPVIPRDTVIHGHVTALKPQLQITLDPITVAGTPISFAGEPFAVKGASRDDTPTTPSELRWHYRMTTKQKLEVTGVVIIVLPIAIAVAAIAVPIVAVVLIASPHGHKHEGTRSTVTLAADASFNSVAIPAPAPYRGLPIIYLFDRYRTTSNQLLCGNQPLFAKAYGTDLTLRVAPETYTFSTSDNKLETATVAAQQDGRYLVFRDKAGLHSIDLATRPDLLENGLPTPEKAKFFFDSITLDAKQIPSVEDDRKRGGCGIIRVLHTRAVPTQPAP